MFMYYNLNLKLLLLLETTFKYIFNKYSLAKGNVQFHHIYNAAESLPGLSAPDSSFV